MTDAAGSDALLSHAVCGMRYAYAYARWRMTDAAGSDALLSHAPQSKQNKAKCTPHTWTPKMCIPNERSKKK
jgi:hypothetical protein